MKKPKWLMGVLSFLLCASLIACSSNTPAEPKEEAKAEIGREKKYLISSIGYIFGNIPPMDGVGLKLINEKFNVDYRPNLVVHSEYLQKLSATIASGNLPDIIALQDADSSFYKWAKQGAFLPIDEFIDKYATLKAVPSNMWSALKVNGHTYAIPRYYPMNYSLTPVIRKDWLDKLGLPIPTSYEELKKVALAFTNQDPDGNGKHDTYGIAIGQAINPAFAMGAYWDTAFYHKNDQGQYINGYIGEGRKQLVSWLTDLYKQNALTKDFAFFNWTQTNKEFYSGRAGIFIGAASGMSETYMQNLLEISPHAKIVPLQPFLAPDGSKGFTSGRGYMGIIALNAKLANEPDKLKRVLEMTDFGRHFYPFEQRNADNKDFDWFRGKSGTGYIVSNGVIQYVPQEKGLAPYDYFADRQMWAPNDKANGYSNSYKIPQLRELTGALEKIH
ncbi:MAG: extracellular solute-binding protein, partial [Paenibacillus sp.]|nr:extracellular solute-binding protein [Paenibacillus sp.]